MSDRLVLADAHTAADVMTFVGRAVRVTDEGIRFQASGGIMRVSAATLAPQGLLDSTPTVIGMRIVNTDPELVCDFAVSAGSLARAEDDDRAILLPSTALSPAWTGVAPPRTGWSHEATLDAHSIGAAAADGIARVAAQLPTDPGEDLVRRVRAGIWAEPEVSLGGLPLGSAFAADALGFLRADEGVELFRADRWARLSTHRGHVLVRMPARSGLTDVRVTGAPSR